MKNRILEVIYHKFHDWSEQEQWACTEGCAVCCTQNVSMTAVEGEKILDHIVREGREKWFAEKLSLPASPQRPEQTINDYARSFLRGEEPSDDNGAGSSRACPFLDDGLCGIYQVRPFSCRCLLSRETCSASRPALMDNRHLAAATAVSQLIEHLGQFEYWGNMLDVLPAMLDISRYRKIRDELEDSSILDSRRMYTLNAKPLPGFLLGPEDYDQVSPLLSAIFNEKIEGNTIKAILNGAT